MLDSTALTTKTQERGALYGSAIPRQPGRVRETGVENEEWLFFSQVIPKKVTEDRLSFKCHRFKVLT